MRGQFRNTGTIRMILACFIGLIIIAGGSVAAEDISVDYSFDRPQIVPITIGGKPYQRLVMTDAPNGGNPGEPALPARGAQILIPAGSQVAGIEVTASTKISLGAGYLVEPNAVPFPLSANPADIAPPVPDRAIYSSVRPFPGVSFKEIGTQSFRGYRLLILKLQPVEYLPAVGELSYTPQLTVTVHLEDSVDRPALYRGLPQDNLDVRRKVDNVLTADSYAAMARQPATAYDLLIITTAVLAASFQPLKDYHDTTGVLTEIHTTTEIGSSNPDDIRDYIRDRYLYDGISYVLIGGDDDIIPAKDLYVDSHAGSIEYSMPGDIYFACLDGGWNYDGDSRWGEPGDGDGGGDVDLVAEVYLGRACVGNTTEADRFVNKTIQYLTATGNYLRNVLSLGEHLGFGGASEYAANSLEEMIGGSSANGYTTVGFPIYKYDIEEIYDRDWSGNSWPISVLISRINDGVHIINHFGHGNTYYALKMTTSDLSALVNSDYFFLYSQACYSGQFDNADCWAERVTTKHDYGAFAVVMNARYGWGSSGSTDGPSQRFAREFWDAVYDAYEYKPQLGKANHDSKEDNLYRINESCMRWCYYELTLFGDPTVAFDVDEPQNKQLLITGEAPDSLGPNQTATFEVIVSGIYGGDPVPGTGQLHYSISGGAVQTVDLTEISRNRYEVILPAVACGETLEYYLSAEEKSDGRMYDPDPAEPYRALPISEVLAAIADNFSTNQGWTVSGDATAGTWARVIPLNKGDDGGPPVDYDNSYYCYVTGNAEYDDVDGGTTILDSPVFELPAADGVVSYARWFSNDLENGARDDVFNVYISNDAGANWTLVETVGPIAGADGGWGENSFWVTDFLAPSAEMQLRFEAADLGEVSCVEAGVDAVTVSYYACYDCQCNGLCDLNQDGALNPVDVVYLVNYVYKGIELLGQLDPSCTSPNGDWNCDAAVNPVDVVLCVNHIYKSGGGPCDPCTQ